MKKRRCSLIARTTIALLVFACFGKVDGFSSGKEVVVINGSNVFSFQATEFDLTRSFHLKDDNAVHLFVDEYPIFNYPNGLGSFVEENIIYPEQAINNNAEGVVLINFIVEKNGSVSNPRIIRGVGYGCDEEVLRLFTDIAIAKPGKIAGQPVRVGVTIPVRFRLEFEIR